MNIKQEHFEQFDNMNDTELVRVYVNLKSKLKQLDKISSPIILAIFMGTLVGGFKIYSDFITATTLKYEDFETMGILINGATSLFLVITCILSGLCVLYWRYYRLLHRDYCYLEILVQQRNIFK